MAKIRLTQEERMIQIRSTLNALTDAWLSTPNLTLGQLLVRCTLTNKDPFYITDHDLAVLLREYVR